jgi:hypothetical protein
VKPYSLTAEKGYFEGVDILPGTGAVIYNVMNCPMSRHSLSLDNHFQ